MFCINSLILFLLVPPPSTDTKKWWDDGTGKIDFEVHCGSNGENIEFLFISELPKADKSRATNQNPFAEDDGFVCE